MSSFIDLSTQREQLVLFTNSLDEVIPHDHPVRLFDDIVRKLDFSRIEQDYVLVKGRPPIHPRVIISVLLWGLLNGVRSSRKLEAALENHLDFRWLTGQLSIDHTTLSQFRQARTVELQDFFERIVCLGRDVGLLRFERAAFDGTRTKAHNRRSGTRTKEQLEAERAEIKQLFAALEQQAVQEDVAEAQAEFQLLKANASEKTAKQPTAAELLTRKQRIEAALAAYQQLGDDGKKLPERLPITDPESRVMPNKEGGFAPNYTPNALVDVHSEMITCCDVTADLTDEDALLPAIQQVQTSFGPTAKLQAVLVDGAFPTGHNLSALEAAQITCYAPSDTTDPAQHPAQRSDLSQPVTSEQLAKLPLMTKRDAKKLPEHERQQFDKGAFVYVAENDTYVCPQGKTLTYKNTTPLKVPHKPTTQRRRYLAQASDCAACPLKKLCLQQDEGKARSVSRDQYEPARERLAAHMAKPESQEIYQLRRHAGETPFAFIKQHLGVRQFLLRGLKKVKQEWRWLCCAYNLRRLMTLWSSRAGPAPDTIAALLPR